MKSLLIIWALVIVTGLAGFSYINSSLASATPGGANANDKYDGDCPTAPDYATVGRCADKCPAGSYLVGYEHGGNAICNQPPTAPTPPENVNQTATSLNIAPQDVNDTPPPIVEGFTGK